MIFLGILEGFIPALVILGVRHLLKDPDHMKDYEEEFIAAHEHERDDLVLSGFNENDTKLFLTLCAQHIKVEKLKKNPPELEFHHIDFKKAAHTAFFVEVIRCNEKYAIIKAPGKQCAYLLRLGKSNPNIGDKMFFFQSKFCYYVKEATSEELRAKERMNTTQEFPNVNVDPLVKSAREEHQRNENSARLLELRVGKQVVQISTPETDDHSGPSSRNMQTKSKSQDSQPRISEEMPDFQDKLPSKNIDSLSPDSEHQLSENSVQRLPMSIGKSVVQISSPEADNSHRSMPKKFKSHYQPMKGFQGVLGGNNSHPLYQQGRQIQVM